MDIHSPGVFKQKSGFPRTRHFQNHMPPSSQRKSSKFGGAVAVYTLPSHRGSSFRGRGGLQRPLAHQGPLSQRGPLLFLQVWVAWTSALPARGRWGMDLGHWPRACIRTRGPPASESRLPRFSVALRRSRLLFLPLFSPLGWRATPVPVAPTPEGWGRRQEGAGTRGAGTRGGDEGAGTGGAGTGGAGTRRDPCTNSPSLGGGAPLPRQGPCGWLCVVQGRQDTARDSRGTETHQRNNRRPEPAARPPRSWLPGAQ